MTNYISFRSDRIGRGLSDPFLLTGTGLGSPPTLAAMTEAQIAAAVQGRHMLLAVHGFNVSYESGVRQMALLGQALSLPASASFFGVLWPGDFILPAINYPFEASDAVWCGRRLGRLCNTRFAGAASLSFMSHSLGGRLVLEAVAGLNRKARSVCLAAAAVDRDVLSRQYSAALGNSESLAVLSSPKDRVLQVAYAGGDFLSDLFGDGDSPFRRALGLLGPRPHPRPDVGDHRIPRDPACGHGGYMPGGSHFPQVSQFVRRCFDGASHSWPPPWS